MSKSQLLSQPLVIVRTGYDAPWIDRQSIALPTLPANIVARLPRTSLSRLTRGN